MQDNLTFVKYIYVEGNTDVIGMRPTFMLQGCGVGGRSRVVGIRYVPRSYYASFIFSKGMLVLHFTY
jgi:hypothetical protein